MLNTIGLSCSTPDLHKSCQKVCMRGGRGREGGRKRERGRGGEELGITVGQHFLSSFPYNSPAKWHITTPKSTDVQPKPTKHTILLVTLEERKHVHVHWQTILCFLLYTWWSAQSSSKTSIRVSWGRHHCTWKTQGGKFDTHTQRSRHEHTGHTRSHTAWSNFPLD